MVIGTFCSVENKVARKQTNKKSRENIVLELLKKTSIVDKNKNTKNLPENKTKIRQIFPITAILIITDARYHDFNGLPVVNWY